MSKRKQRQCKACPWRVGVKPASDIPNGYCAAKHEALSGTIVDGFAPGPLRAMACHESPIGRERYCVGWLANQLGSGGNLALRLKAVRGELPAFSLVGPQHERFEDTLP